MIGSLWSYGNRQIALTGSSSSRFLKKVPPQSRHKLHLFVVAASSSLALRKTLSIVRSSIWWNHLALFLILDWPPSNRDCDNAREILWSAWESNILRAVFFCLRRSGRIAEDRLIIYTFNPYTSQAPKPWKVQGIYSGKNNHPWTLFARGHEDSMGICENLDFDKTNDLGGYEIRVSVTSFGAETDDSGGSCSGVYEKMHCEVLFPTLNATPRVLVHNALTMSSIGYVDDEGNPNGILAEIFNGSTDIGLTGRFLTALRNLPCLYTHWQSEIRSITQYRGFKSQLSKIHSVIDGDSRSGLCLVLVTTILFFRYFDRQSLTVAHLNTVRVICNSTLPRIPRDVAPRIYLGSLFLFALTIQVGMKE